MTELVTQMRDNHCHLCHQGADEIERQRIYIAIVESYLDRETLKEVLTKYRNTPDGGASLETRI